MKGKEPNKNFDRYDNKNGVSIAQYLSPNNKRTLLIEIIKQDPALSQENKDKLIQELHLWCDNSSESRSKFVEKTQKRNLRSKSTGLMEKDITVEEHKELKPSSQTPLSKSSSTSLPQRPHVKFLNSNDDEQKLLDGRPRSKSSSPRENSLFRRSSAKSGESPKGSPRTISITSRKASPRFDDSSCADSSQPSSASGSDALEDYKEKKLKLSFNSLSKMLSMGKKEHLVVRTNDNDSNDIKIPIDENTMQIFLQTAYLHFQSKSIQMEIPQNICDENGQLIKVITHDIIAVPDSVSDKKCKAYYLDKDKVSGEGGLGKIYPAFDLETGKLIAAKEFFNTFTTNNAHRLAEDMVKALITMDRYYGDDLYHNPPIVLMEHYPGVPLTNIYYELDKSYPKDDHRHYSKKKEVPPFATLHIIILLIDKLILLHGKGLLHRDVKIDNYLIQVPEKLPGVPDWDNFLCIICNLIDLDGAVFEEDKRTDNIDSSVGYTFPPEKGKPCTRKMDIYSLAITIAEMVSRKNYKEEVAALWKKLRMENNGYDIARQMVEKMIADVFDKETNMETLDFSDNDYTKYINKIIYNRIILTAINESIYAMFYPTDISLQDQSNKLKKVLYACINLSGMLVENFNAAIQSQNEVNDLIQYLFEKKFSKEIYESIKEQINLELRTDISELLKKVLNASSSSSENDEISSLRI